MSEIIVVEDRERIQELVELALEDTAHRVIERAYNFDQAISLIGAIASGDLRPQGILLDGNLPGSRRQKSEDSRDCPDAVAWLDEWDRRTVGLGPFHIAFIGFSSYPNSDPRITIDLGKDNFVTRLPGLLDRLPSLTRAG